MSCHNYFVGIVQGMTLSNRRYLTGEIAAKLDEHFSRAGEIVIAMPATAFDAATNLPTTIFH